jgi:hypothetical protein
MLFSFVGLAMFKYLGITFFENSVTVIQMKHFKIRETTATAICVAHWGVLNATTAPLLFRVFGLPFVSVLIGFSALIRATQLTRKFGAIAIIGLIAAVTNFTFGSQMNFLCFTLASVSFVLATRLIGFNFLFKETSILGQSHVGFGPFSCRRWTPNRYPFYISKLGGCFKRVTGLLVADGVICRLIRTLLIAALNSRKTVSNIHVHPQTS